LILRDVGIINWRSKRRPILIADHARLRLAFALANLNTDWTNVIFLDECSVKKGVGKQQTWSFGYPLEKWHSNKVDRYPKGKQGSITVCVAIALLFNRSDLVLMDRDLAAPKGGYSAVPYIKTLEEGFLPIYNGETYMQDNAPVHKARITLAWLAD
jgi:hypothetical protein